MTRLTRLFAGSAAALSVIAFSTAAYAQKFTFSIHHFLSPKAPAQTVLLEPWVAAVEEASNGRIAFEISPAMSLGGAPPDLFSQVRDGVADLVWTVPGYTPGTFPRQRSSSCQTFTPVTRCILQAATSPRQPIFRA